jgi:hypothetical protein
MEFSTFHNDLAGTDIKPKVLLERYLALVEKDNQTYFSANETHASDCPACGSRETKPVARKSAMDYVDCANCSTVFVANRPNQAAIDRFYLKSEARRFWLSEIWTKTQQVRHEKILGPLNDWLETFLVEAFPNEPSIEVVDYRASNWGLSETLNKTGSRLKAKLVQPMFDVSSAPQDQRPMETAGDLASKKFKAVSLIETLGRVESPLEVLKWAFDHLEVDGLCFITTVLSTGFDVQVLGSKSNALVPPDRLNLLSFEGLQMLIQETGFEVVEMSTPGVLDLQNVKSAMSDGAEVPSFVRYMIEKRANNARFVYDFETFLQSNGLSSQGRVVLRKGKK